jgi:hypothetical protein
MLFLWTILIWWRPTISHHSVLLIFRRSLLLVLSDHQISALCQAWTKSKSSWWNSKENDEFTWSKISWAAQKEKIKQATKSKTWRLASNDLLGPSIRRKRRVCRDPAPSDTPPDSNTELAVTLADDLKRMRNKTLIVCSVTLLSLNNTMEGSEYDVRNIGHGRTYCVLVRRKILFVCLVRDKHCFVLSLHPL